MSDPTTFTLVTKTGTNTGAGDAIYAGNAKGFLVHAKAATASTSTILIQGSLDNSVWYTLVTITNVGAEPDGAAYRGGAWPYMRANVSAHSGGGTIIVYGWALDYDPGYWVSAVAPTNTATAIACTSLTDSGLTSGRMTVASTGGLLADQAGLTAAAGVITCAGLKDSSGTATYVPYMGASKELAYSSAFNFTASGAILASTVLQGGSKQTIAAKTGNGAISSAPGVIIITKGSALGSSTLADPTTTTHDGYVLTIVAGTAYPHEVICNSGKVNGGTNVLMTFGGAVGDSITLVAYQGVWYSIANVNVTIS